LLRFGPKNTAVDVDVRMSDVRDLLVQCKDRLQSAQSDSRRLLAVDILVHLLGLCDENRLTQATMDLLLESVSDIEEVRLLKVAAHERSRNESAPTTSAAPLLTEGGLKSEVPHPLK
jgi:hypothetical protein